MSENKIQNSSIVLCPLGYYYTIWDKHKKLRYCSADEDEYYKTYKECLEALHIFITNK